MLRLCDRAWWLCQWYRSGRWCLDRWSAKVDRRRYCDYHARVARQEAVLLHACNLERQRRGISPVRVLPQSLRLAR